MTKKEMIKKLVLDWVRNASGDERKNRFVHHDAIENRIDRKWTREGIESSYDMYKRGDKNIERTIAWLDR